MVGKTRVIGVMTGTSLDGVDLVCVDFDNSDYASYDIVAAVTYDYESGWVDRLKAAFDKEVDELKGLSLDYGIYIGQQILRFIDRYNIIGVDYVASHGYTVFHKPDEGFTLQIGDGDQIAKVTGLNTVYDFRTQDVALGGQGAPLVPIGDQLLFGEYDVCLNLGGFANLSFDDNGVRKAYDVCPINIVLNHYVSKIGLSYDDEGKIAQSGVVSEQLLKELNALSFYTDEEPKSLGFEFVTNAVIPIIEKYNLSLPDVLRTYVAHAVGQLVLKLKGKGSVLATGGGVYNTFFIDLLNERLGGTLVIPSNETVEFKEALIFALLGILRVNNEINCLKSVTKSKKDHSSGQICMVN